LLPDYRATYRADPDRFAELHLGRHDAAALGLDKLNHVILERQAAPFAAGISLRFRVYLGKPLGTIASPVLQRPHRALAFTPTDLLWKQTS
jgi:hypothetical protein